MLNNTSLFIGPLEFTHQVQKINIQERKAVQVLETARSNKNYIVDSGDSEAKAQIRLLFTGLDEINGVAKSDNSGAIETSSKLAKQANEIYAQKSWFELIDKIGTSPERRAEIDSLSKQLLNTTFTSKDQDIGTVYEVSGLRALIALFKCCPIVTIKNEYITSSWKKADKIYDQENYSKLKTYLEEVTALNNNILTSTQSEEYLNLQDFSSDDARLKTNEELRKDYDTAVKNINVIKQLNEKVANNTAGITPDSLKGIGQFTDYSFGNINFPDGFIKQNYIAPTNICVALESLELENVPDIPYAIQVTLTIARIDTEPFTKSGELEYSTVDGVSDRSSDPVRAYWLKKWIYKLLSLNTIPELTEGDFKTADFTWYGRTPIGAPIDRINVNNKFSLDVGTSDTVDSNKGILLNENCSLRHKFAYNKIIGKVYPTAAHMGTTARFMSLDIVFNRQTSNEEYTEFCKFKYTSDEINKERERFDRISGWEVTTPISKLLSTRKNPTSQYSPKSGPYAGVYVPLSIFSETGSEPYMANVRIDLAENNVSFTSENEIVLESGGTEGESLKKYYDDVLKQEFIFRNKLITDPASYLSATSNPEDTIENNPLGAYQLFWPIETGGLRIKDESGFGILNIDSFRAAILELGGEDFRRILEKSLITSGQLYANRRVNAADKVTRNVGFTWDGTFGQGDIGSNPLYSDIYNQIKDIVNNKLFKSTDITYKPRKNKDFIPGGYSERKAAGARDIELLKELCIYLLTLGFTGDRTEGSLISLYLFNDSATGTAILNIASSNAEFSTEFKEALFKVLYQRKPKPSSLPYIFKMDGLHSGFYKLILSYSLDRDKQRKPEDLRRDLNEDIVRRNANKNGNSMYPDLLLPTYIELYGFRWEEFAPTIEDLGILVSEPMGDNKPLLAVSEDDIVSPAAWFYIERNKDSLNNSLKKAIDAVNLASPDLAISVPFNTKDIEDLKNKIAEKNNTKLGKEERKKAEDTINEIITKSFLEYKSYNPSGFREDVATVLSSASKFEKKFLSGDETIFLFASNRGTYAIPREVNIPGLGSEIYRVVTNSTLLEVDQPDLLDNTIEATYVTPLNKQAAFLRGSKNQTEATLKSSLSQIPDDHTSPERMFPAIKVYLVDRRGTDLIADDTLFNLNCLISVDITMDKDDAPVAVIRLADPLYILQSSYFDKKNYAYSGESGKDKNKIPDRIFNSLNGPDKDSFLRRYKLAQGRAVQIRMGYSSMAHNLPIVFTGRISEISPGDELTIVCQGWKAELINRQVNFYNEDARNWGARDLAIMAIKYSNPDGIGDKYPEFDAQFIYRNMDPADLELLLDNVLRNKDGVEVDGEGDRTVSASISNFFSWYLEGNTVDNKKDLGFDTRLKNIWYPDTQLYSNALGLRSFFRVMPSWTNDSWIVPLQPAWDVLKEASRHAWNCIVDVVPYDSYATLFMGHPDQPYYYTRGDRYSRKTFAENNKKATKRFGEIFSDLLQGFRASDYFDIGGEKTSENFIPIGNTEGEGFNTSFPVSYNTEQGFPETVEYFKASAKLIFYSKSLKEFIKKYNAQVSFLDPIFGRSGRLEAIYQSIAKDGTTSGLLKQLSDSLTTNLPLFLFCYFFSLDITRTKQTWPTCSSDLIRILSNLEIAETNAEIQSRLETLPTTSYQDTELVFNLFQKATDYRNTILSKDTDIDTRLSKTSSINPSTRRALRDVTHDLSLIFEIINQSKQVLPSLAPRFSEVEKSLTEFGFQYRRGQSARGYVSVPRDKEQQLYNIVNTVVEILQNRTNNKFINTSGINIAKEIGLDSFESSDSITDNMVYFKAFVHYFCLYLSSTPDNNRQQLQSILDNYDKNTLPPNMKVFRVHHFADDTHNIIKNNIVASTKEMWNTVVIEHPSPGTANDNITDENVYRTGTLNTGIEWVYWPKQEITGVIGLQYHPGLTLANKKIKVFTELNCQSPDLAAKLACHHLAEGIKKMYRGNLIMMGKHMKPHDRIILADSYNKMKGPVEIESLVHHWNTDQGWITNVIPNAVCESNPGSSVLQTAAMEATFQSVFDTIDFISTALTFLTIVATAGAGTPLAASAGFSVRAGLRSIFSSKFLNKSLLKTYGKNLKQRATEISSGITKTWGSTTGWGKLNTLKAAYNEISGPLGSLFLNEVFLGTAQWGAGLFYKHSAIASYAEIGNDVQQLPIIFTPLLYNGNAFTAGLETEDTIWGIGAFGTYYSFKEMQANASRAWEALVEGE